MSGFRAGHVWWVVGAALAAVIIRFFARGYAIRKRFHSLPGPPHSWIWGHLKVMGEAMQDIPPRAHPHVTPLRIQKKYNLPNYFYMDLWPFADSMLNCFDPTIANNLTIDNPLPKHPGMAVFLDILAGPGNIVSGNGQQWKTWRSIFNPGFAASHMMTLVPEIVDQSMIFAKKLTEHAKRNEVFRLEEDATTLTFDIIGKVALDLQLGTQTGENEMITAFREQVQLCPNEGMKAPFKMWNPYGMYRRWRNSQIMDAYIGKVLDERFANQGADSNDAVSPGQRKQRKRAIIDLALEAYRSEKAGEGSPASRSSPGAGIDEEFRKMAIIQIRAFLFAGHDTTSSTICYALYMLQKHPRCLEQIRKEHDEVLGSVEKTPQVIKEDPHVLNRLEYTSAVVRETLRLFTAASGTRLGEAGSFTRDPDTGEVLPLDDMLTWIIPYGIHRNPSVWGDTVDIFDPARFLPENAAKLPENGWRAFEKGPRNCIGQELAMVESRIILALVVRSFEFKTAYDALDELKNDGSFWAMDESWREGKQDLDGEEAYQVLIGTAKPREGMPVRVKKVS